MATPSNMIRHVTLLAYAVGASAPIAAHACATCDCSLSTDAMMGYSAIPGWRTDFEYTYLPQNQLRNGTHAVTSTQAAAINDVGGSQEVERQIINHYINLGINHSLDSNWNFGVTVPYVDCSHTTYGTATPDQLIPGNVSDGTTSGLGDIKLTASYQSFLPTRNLGLQLSIKLPTDRYGRQNVLTGNTVGRNPMSFNSGPSATGGQVLDINLQPSTGSTDVILDVYYYQPVSQDFDAFTSGQFQAAVHQRLNETGTDFRPGNFATMSSGVCYEANPYVIPQLRFNVIRKNVDKDALVDTTNTVGTVIYLSPGMAVSVARNVQVYAFLQKVLYSNLQGYQLFPRLSNIVGASYALRYGVLSAAHMVTTYVAASGQHGGAGYRAGQPISRCTCRKP